MALCLIAVLMIMTVAGAPGTQNAQAKAKPVLNKKKVSLIVGEKVTLKLKNWKKRVTWSSSKKSVATVSKKGVVQARKKGRANITAKAGGKKYLCRVTVATAKPGPKRTPAVTSTRKPPAVQTRRPAAAPTRTPAAVPTRMPVAIPTATPSANPGQSPGNEDDYAVQVLELVNAARAEEGLSPLVLDPAICVAASARSQELIETFSHTRPDGTDCFTVFAEFGISYMAAGENIAAGQKTPEAVMTAWMNSPGHRKNILSSSFKKLGVGLVKTESGYKYYWTQLFTG